jgi:hypothetical protein
MKRALLVAAVLLVIIAIAYWWFMKETVRFTISTITMVPSSDKMTGGDVLVLSGMTTSKSDPKSWGGRPIKIHTKSLGYLKSAVSAVAVSNGAGTITTMPVMVSNPSAYAPGASDYARVFLKPSMKY